jgi:hypothetical protein
MFEPHKVWSALTAMFVEHMLHLVCGLYFQRDHWFFKKSLMEEKQYSSALALNLTGIVHPARCSC